MAQISKNFTEEEIRCPCCCACNIHPDFMFRLQRLRTYMARPFTINSAYRCKAHNLSIGGAKKSRHMNGIAADISIRGWTSREKYTCLKLAYGLGFRGIGIAPTFIHLDTRPDEEKLWVYS
jgi:zinc D-Ala-D-Ala carboxypeptidase